MEKPTCKTCGHWFDYEVEGDDKGECCNDEIITYADWHCPVHTAWQDWIDYNKIN